MEKNYLNKLKEINTSKIAYSVAEELRGRETTDKFQLKSVVVSYVLYRAALDENVCIDSLEEFFQNSVMPEDLKNIVNKNLANIWGVITSLKNKYSADELLSYILFNNDLEDTKSSDCSTPDGIIKLADTILDVQKNDSVLELCSGKGNFFTETFLYQEKFNYFGVELNYTANEIAQIRAALMDENISLILNDALEYRNGKKFDKLFANYPFMVKNPSMDEYKGNICKAFDIPIDVIQRASSDWIFNATIIDQMKESGKAVAIMTNGATWNSSDKKIRKFFIENGYVEAVISLPAKLFNGFAIPTTLIVFSKNNKKIKMVDAREICGRERRNNVLTDDCVSKIIELLQNDGEKSITKTIEEFANNEYVLNATRYLEVVPKIENGLELGAVTKQITRGAQIKAAELDEIKANEATPYKYLTLANINDGIISTDDEQYLREIPENLKKFCVKNNSIILTKTGMPEVKTAVVQIEENTELLATGNLFIIEVDETKINPFYVQAFFASETGVSLFRSISTGSVLPTISLSKLKSLVIPAPPMEEQIVIANKYAAAMDEIILLKRKLEKGIAKMKHLYDEEV